MRTLLGRIGTGPRIAVTILGGVVAALIALGLLALITGETSAFLGALVLAILVGVPMRIVYLVARIVHKPAPPAIAPPPPAPAGGFQPYPLDEQLLHKPDDLR